MERVKICCFKWWNSLPINHDPFQEKNETSSNFTVPVFLTICHLIYVSESLVFPKNSDRNQSFFNLQEDFQKRKLIIFFFFLPLAVLYVSHTIYPRTPIDTPRRPLTPQDAIYMVRKPFILFCMINYHEVITFLVYITVFHRRTYKLLQCILNLHSKYH